MVLVITFIGLRKESNHNEIILNHTHNHRPTSLRWIKSFLYYKMDKKSIVNDLYQAAVISVLAVGYSMLGKKILKMTPPSIQKFDLEDTEKLVAIIAAPPENPQVVYHLSVIQAKQKGLKNKEQMFKQKYEKYNKIFNRLTWLNACSSGISVATGISSVATFATFVGLPVSVALGAASLTGAIASGIFQR